MLVQSPDALERAQLELLGALLVPAAARAETMALVAQHSVHLSLNHGVTPQAAPAFCALGAIMIGRWGQSGQALELVELAERLTRGDAASRLGVEIFKWGLVLPWTGHYRQSIEPLRRAERAAAARGLHEWAMMAAQKVALARLFSGAPLRTVELEASKALAQSERAGAGPEGAVLRSLVCAARSLCAETALEETPGATVDHRAALAFARLVLQDYEGAYTISADAPQGAGAPIEIELCLIHGLAAAALCDEKPSERSTLAAKLRRSLERLRRWKDRLRSESFEHRVLLLEAEEARIEGRAAAAVSLYIEAGERALALELGNFAAICAERRALAAAQAGWPAYQREALTRAIELYSAWGAMRRVQAIRRAHPVLNERAMPPVRNAASRYSSRSSISEMDIAAALKSARAISEEVELGRVVERALGAAIEIAGAERGALLLLKAGRLFVEARGQAASGIRRVLPPAVLESQEGLLPCSVVRFVERTRETVVLANAQQDELFKHEQYIRTRRTRSLLCAPVLKGADLLGVLYLENNLGGGGLLTVTPRGAAPAVRASGGLDRERASGAGADPGQQRAGAQGGGAHERAGRGARRCGGRSAGQEQLPGDDEPRDPHPDERRDSA